MEKNRDRMIREHEMLRRELADLEASARRFRREGLHLLGPLREQTESFAVLLRRHMAWEEGLLPSHGKAGAHRDLEDERRLRVHREQCKLLDALVEDLREASRPPAIISAHVAAMAGLLLRDFLEEREDLPPKLPSASDAGRPGKTLH